MKPRIFVSSTFYDLKYIREDLSNYIKAHDFEPILFEDGDIGYTPGKPLDMACYETMRNTDMVLLIVGGLYGSPATGEQKDSFKEYMSITRNEFKSAVDEGVPVYVFVDTKVYTEYFVYEINEEKIEAREIDIVFNTTKDLNVFRFIREIKNIGNISITEFSKISHIKDFLGKQWSDMFKKYLDSLKEQNEERKIENSVNEMKKLINRMDMMLTGIGKKVLGSDYEINYNDLVEEIEVKTLCDILVAHFKVDDVKADLREREACVYIYLEAIKQYIEAVSKMKNSPEDAYEYYSDYILENLANGCGMDNSIQNYLDEIKRITDEDIYNKVRSVLMSDFYYNYIFNIKG